MQVVITGTITFPFGLLSAPLSFDAPTKAELRATIRTATGDPNGAVFTDPVIDLLIADAFVEISRIYPKEMIDHITLSSGVFRYSTYAEDPWRVENVPVSGNTFEIRKDSGDRGLADGWDFYAGQVIIPDWSLFTATGVDATSDILRVWGYGRRFAPTSDDDLCDVDAEADSAIRHYATLQGYQRLVNQRADFSQWNALPGNSDVSLAQLLSMIDVYNRQWNEIRKRLRTLRRV